MAAIIPYEQQTSQSPSGNMPHMSAEDPVAQGLQNLAGGLNRINDAVYERKKKMDAAQSALALATYNNDIRDAHDEIARGITDGSIDPMQADSAFRSASEKVRAANIGGLSPSQQAELQPHLVGTDGALMRNLKVAVAVRGQSDTAATIDSFAEQTQRAAPRIGAQAAAEKFRDFLAFAGPTAGLSPEAITKRAQAFTENAYYTAFDAAGVKALQSGDPQQVQDVMEHLASKDGEPMDPDRRSRLTTQFMGWKNHLLAKQAGAANAIESERIARENAGADVYNKSLDLAASGQYLSPEWIASSTQAVAGTESAGPFKSLLESQQSIAGFASMPAAERTSFLTGQQQRAATKGVGTDPDTAKLLTGLQKINTNLTEAIKQNPWQAAQKSGVIQEASAFDASNPTNALAVVQNRMQNIGKVEAWAGHAVSPLQPEEMAQVSKVVRNMPIDQVGTFLGQLGGAVGDQDRVTALAKQMGEKDETISLAMLYANSKTNQGRYVSEILLRGEQAIKDKVVKPDGMMETGWRASIAQQVRGVFANRDAENKMIDSAFLILAGRSADSTQSHVDVDNAVKLATGGIIDHNGAKIPLPYGMAADGVSAGAAKFDKAIAAITPQALTAQVPDGKVYVGKTAIPLDTFVQQLSKAQLVHAGQGLYSVRAGTGTATNVKGQRIILQVAP